MFCAGSPASRPTLSQASAYRAGAISSRAAVSCDNFMAALYEPKGRPRRNLSADLRPRWKERTTTETPEHWGAFETTRNLEKHENRIVSFRYRPTKGAG